MPPSPRPARPSAISTLALRPSLRILPRPIRRRIGLIVWGIGAGVYLLAVFHRTSLGVAGPMAEQRFGLSATQLGSFVVLQLGIYALMQVPTGILVDRFGARRMLLAATVTMGIAQIGFALVHTYPLALLARGLLGCGDAMTYISVLRLVAGWLPARRYAVLTSITGLIGSVGNLAATLPLTFLLKGVGWTTTFIVAGSLSLAYGLLLLRPALRRPIRQVTDRADEEDVAGHRVWQQVKQAWRLPAGRLGFWVHFSTMGAPVAFAVLWAYPYLTDGLRYSDSLASTMLLLLVLVGAVASLTIGVVVTRRPASRTPIAMVVVLACLLAWITLIAWPGGRPPLGVVTAVMVILGTGGPASAVAFFLARDYNPRHRISTATGLVNVGGFTGAVLCVSLFGQILDIVDPGARVRSITAFRWALSALAVITAFGLFRLVTWWLRTRAEVLLAAARGEEVPVNIRRHRWELVDTVQLAQVAQQVHRQTDEGPAEQAATADANGPADAEPTDEESADAEPADEETASAEPADAEPADAEPADEAGTPTP